ncbi:hypothetical protein N3K63_04285 [Microbacterium sp. W1N]|uniref:hypothetical protein n=1 Tax=Microbacterium festucae TaxID=2977531 RepID=UPI0021BF961D|nr:hypothetical protein [Microbacterium festucae]MCT9819501.1 hypothetical protein [Microbacterium festucae]
MTLRSYRRGAMLAAVGVGAAFLWMLLSILIGPTAAHADDDDRPLGSLLDAVGEVLTPVTDTVGAVLTPVTTTVSEVVAPITTPIVEPVGEVVTPVLEPLAPVIAPVAEVVAPVVAATEPVLEVVEPVVDAAAPVLGPVIDVVTDATAPLAPVLAPVLETLDPVVGALTPVLDEVAALPVVDRLVPPLQGAGLPLPGDADGPATAASLPVIAARATASAPVAGQPPAEPVLVFAPALSATAATLATVVLPMGPTDAVAPAGSTSPPMGLLAPLGSATSLFATSAGWGLGLSALLAFGLLAAHRAWVLRRRPRDEWALPAPVLATDVSPD